MSSLGLAYRGHGRSCRRHWSLLALLAGWAAGCDLPGAPKAGDRYVAPGSQRSFDVLFQQNCVGCHGADGNLGPAPPLNDKLFLAVIPQTELQRVISEGRPGTLMPAFDKANGGPLAPEQVAVLAGGIRSRWGPVEPAPPSGAPPYALSKAQPANGGAGNVEQGRRVFARACASCHGDDGEGGESAGAINDRDFLALISDQALRRFVITGRPDLGMPDYRDPDGRPEGFQPLTGDDVTSVAALMAHWRQVESVRREGE
jgi:cytochrome c oxidase cbb3-type subunit 3